jgi:Fe-S cluster biogenesis protein NfuA
MLNLKDKEDLMKEIEAALDEIRPHLLTDGGDIEVMDITSDYKVQVLLKGNCESCKFSSMTMKSGVEQLIMAKFDKITGVEAINKMTV